MAPISQYSQTIKWLLGSIEEAQLAIRYGADALGLVAKMQLGDRYSKSHMIGN